MHYRNMRVLMVALAALLCAGQLCGDTLRAALGYFGGQLGPAELAGSTFSQLQVRGDAALPRPLLDCLIVCVIGVHRNSQSCWPPALGVQCAGKSGVLLCASWH